MSFIAKIAKKISVKPLAGKFANLKIRTKVSVGFAIVLVLLAVGGAAAVLSVSTIGRDFGTYRDGAEMVKQIDRVEAWLLTLQRHTMQFALTGDADASSKARHAGKQATLATDEAMGLLKTPAQREKVENIKAKLAAYLAVFDKVADYRMKLGMERDEGVEATASELETIFEEMTEIAARMDDAYIRMHVANATRSMMAGLRFAGESFARTNMLDVKRAEMSFTELKQTMETIKASAMNEKLSALADRAGAMADRFKVSFAKAMEYSVEMKRLTHADLAQNSEAIDEAIQVIKTAVNEAEAAIIVKVNGVIGLSRIVNIGLMAAGLVIGIAAAWMIGRGIAGPVISMTATMRKLADGDTMVDIPGVERRDEVGQMANTVQVFRDNMVKADELAAEQRAEQERKEKRQQAVEGHIAQFETSIAAALNLLANAATELQSTANSMSATAEETQQQTATVVSASDQASNNVQTAASAADELSSSISEINRQVAQSTQITGQAVEEASSTDGKVQRLAEAAHKIGDVVELINDIAGQTNLLALNATIEAARAGEAGKGFAVVASEVKSLATQTAKATEEISSLITAIQSETQDSVESIQSIGRTIGDVNQITTTIAAAVEEQGAATQEIARNVQQAAVASSDVSQNIASVQEAATQTGAAASQVLTSAEELAKQAETLRGDVDTFLRNIRAA